MVARIPEEHHADLNNDINSDGHLYLIADKLSNWMDRPDLLLLARNPDVADILAIYPNNHAQQR